MEARAVIALIAKENLQNGLKKKYDNIANLNEAYGTVFWSQEYSSFDDVILPFYTSCEGTYGDQWAHNPSLDMDFYRFRLNHGLNLSECRLI